MDISLSIESEIHHLKQKLINHRIYNHLSNIEDVKIFTQYHVFAVWDFMSLLKSLQNSLTCVDIPWLPNKNSNTARFINEIVLGEETDVNENGIYKSHFDMYIDAMKDIGADTSMILKFINYLSNGHSVTDAMQKIDADKAVCEFVKFSFDTIMKNKEHVIASVFTFGREGLIADMFIEIINHSSKINNKSYNSMIYYLERHVELDGDEHGPMSMKMIQELCGNDEQKIIETISAAKDALQHRINLWDRISEAIQENKKV